MSLFLRALLDGILPSVPGSIEITRHLTMFVAFLGSFISAMRGSLITLTKESCFDTDGEPTFAKSLSKIVALVIMASLTLASYEVYDLEPPRMIFSFLSIKDFLAIMPLGFFIIFCLWFFRLKTKIEFIFAGLILLILYSLSHFESLAVTYEWFQSSQLIFYLFLISVFFAVVNGMPVFCVLGGLAILFFWHDGTPTAAVSAEIYRMVASPMLPSLALLLLQVICLLKARLLSGFFICVATLLDGFLVGCQLLLVFLVASFLL